MRETLNFLKAGCHSGVFIVNLEHISHLVLVFVLLSLSRLIPDGQEL